MTNTTVTKEATAAFDKLSEEIYYGFNFKIVMIENPELIHEVKSLVEKIHNARMDNSTKLVQC